MNNSKVIIDTNIIIDVFVVREPFYESSHQILRMCEDDKIQGFISASTATDIYYLIRKYAGRDVAEDALGHMLAITTVLDVTGEDVITAYGRHSSDFEDCLLGVCAAKAGIDTIITRDKKGFNTCGIPYVSATDFLSKQ